jgi:uncharacterized protein YbcC (UPF0753/DUF2309 family)
MQFIVERENIFEATNRKTIESFKASSVERLIERVLSRIAPTWDTRDYVAVNPFWGYRGEEFLKVIRKIHNIKDTLLLPHKSYLKEKYLAQQILKSDLSGAIVLYQEQTEGEEVGSIELDQLVEFLYEERYSPFASEQTRCMTDLYDIEFQSKETIRITHEVSKWLSAYFDEGQSIWKIPKSSSGLYATWQNLASFDNAQFGNRIKFNEFVASLPSEPGKAILNLCNVVFKRTRIDEKQIEIYLERLLATVSGWASLVKKIDFERELLGSEASVKDPTGLIDLLAIRLAYDVAYLKDSISIKDLTNEASLPEVYNSNILKNYLWLLADEISVRRRISENIKFDNLEEESKRPLAQMAFCIDVRSEIMRRQIERASDEIQTLGFAGFFGVPIAIKKLGYEAVDNQCPVLMKPLLEVRENCEYPEHVIGKRQKYFFRKFSMKNSHQSSHSSFSLAETFGFVYAGKMLANVFSVAKPNINFSSYGENLSLNISEINIETKIQLAYGALYNMGLTKHFGRYVIFFGHGGESANNPYHGALDCGACAGHNGKYNSKFLAKILREDEVREGLRGFGVEIPFDTRFYSGWHNTTTDQLNIDEEEDTEEFQKIRDLISNASDACRVERVGLLVQKNTDKLMSSANECKVRANDWSEARPEWALARNHSFIIGRRWLTRCADLEGRSFLHDYDQSTDPDLRKLELIMTAPMIVTNWINMQYYVSTIDPEKFGTGNKVLNNVVGTIGCIQGNESDLLTGLSEQSVRLNGNYFHEPVRLQVFIEASPISIDKVIAKHDMVSDLVNNNWLNIVSIDPKERSFKLRLRNQWIDARAALWS